MRAQQPFETRVASIYLFYSLPESGTEERRCLQPNCTLVTGSRSSALKKHTRKMHPEAYERVVEMPIFTLYGSESLPV